MLSTLSGIYNVLNSFSLLSTYDNALPKTSPFYVEIVAPTQGEIITASGLALKTQRPFTDITSTDIVIVPSVMVEQGEWKTGRYSGLIQWL